MLHGLYTCRNAVTEVTESALQVKQDLNYADILTTKEVENETYQVNRMEKTSRVERTWFETTKEA